MLDRFSLLFWNYGPLWSYLLDLLAFLVLNADLSFNSCHQKKPQKKDTCLCHVIVM